MRSTSRGLVVIHSVTHTHRDTHRHNVRVRKQFSTKKKSVVHVHFHEPRMPPPLVAVTTTQKRPSNAQNKNQIAVLNICVHSLFFFRLMSRFLHERVNVCV